MVTLKIIDLCDGVPFVDKTFNTAKLWGALGAKRAHIMKRPFKSGDDLYEIIRPENALQFARNHYDKPERIDAILAPPQQMKRINEAKAYVLTHCKQWQNLVMGPFLYFSLTHRGMYSLSNPLIPQCIFLGPEAYESPKNLPETLVHELAHVWCGLIHEISPLVLGYEQTFTLPSGTSGKTALGTLLAAHFAASALAFHMQMPIQPKSRMLYLYNYLTNTLETLQKARELSREGKGLLSRLHQFKSAVKDYVLIAKTHDFGL